MRCGRSVFLCASLAALASLAAPQAAGAEAAQPRPRDEARSLRVGEKLIYNVKVKGISAGQAILAVERETEADGRAVCEVTLRVRSNRFASMFCVVDDLATSIIQKEPMRSLGYSATKLENERRIVERITPDYAAMKASTFRQKGESKPKECSVELPGDMQDPVSWFVALRSLSLVEEAPPAPAGAKPARGAAPQTGADGAAGDPPKESASGADAPRNRLVIASTGGRAMSVEFKVIGTEDVKVKGHGALKAFKVAIAGGGEALMGKDGEATLWIEKRTMIPLRIVVITGGYACGMYLSETVGSALD